MKTKKPIRAQRQINRRIEYLYLANLRSKICKNSIKEIEERLWKLENKLGLQKSMRWL